MKKSIHENFAKFFEEPTRESLKELLKNNFGEDHFLDFKAQWPEKSSLAKHILAFSNTGPGCIVIGVEEKEDKSLFHKGLESVEDKADIIKKIKKYLPEDFLSKIEILDFSYKTSDYETIKDRSFQVLFIESDDTQIPAISTAKGTSINEARIYVRRHSESVEANKIELEKIINRRIESGYSSSREMELEDHLKQLKNLYGQISRTYTRTPDLNKMLMGGFAYSEDNPEYPDESFDSFISKLIEHKKKAITQLVKIN